MSNKPKRLARHQGNARGQADSAQALAKYRGIFLGNRDEKIFPSNNKQQ